MILIALMGLLIIGLCILATLQISNLTTMSKSYLAVSILVVIGLILGVMGLYHYNQVQYYDIIKENVRRKVYRPLQYEYGVTAADIKRRFQINPSTFLSNDEESLSDLWNRLMVQSPDIIRNFITELLGSCPPGSTDMCFNLAWYLCIADQPLRNHLSDAEIQYIYYLDDATLLQLVNDCIRPIPTVQSEYEGATDRASLIFTLLSGYIVPPVEMSDRYQTVKTYSPRIVYNLAFKYHQLIDEAEQKYQLQAPYLYLANQDPSPIELMLDNLNEYTAQELIDHFGLGLEHQLETLSVDRQTQLLQNELSLYNNVIQRPSNMVLPPPLTDLSSPDIYKILSYYTNLELVQYYEPRLKWTCRNDLLKIIHDDLRGISRWSLIAHQHCTNDDTINIMSGESHSEVDKDDVEDPTLSYGFHKNYQCYQMSELEGAFREYDGIFRFRVPDYVDSGPSDFPLDSIRDLRTLLIEEQYTGELLTIIDVGLREFETAKVKTHLYRKQYQKFSEEDQQLIRLYLAWMFNYSMWMRFWKGPGNPWPLQKVNVTFALTRNYGQRASPEERDEHVFIQEGIRTRLIEQFEQNPNLLEWMNTLPAVHYEFDTGKSHCATYPIVETMDRLALGDMCMGFGSDHILKTSYYYIIYLLNPSDFDDFISQYMTDLLELEQEIILDQHKTMIGRDNPTRVRVTNARLSAIENGFDAQPPFDPRQYETNVHVN